MGLEAIRLHWLKPRRCSRHRRSPPRQCAEKQRQLHYLVTRRWPPRQHAQKQRQLKHLHTHLYRRGAFVTIILPS